MQKLRRKDFDAQGTKLFYFYLFTTFFTLYSVEERRGKNGKVIKK